MIELANPESAGLSADRLERIAAHFNRYVDEGLIPGLYRPDRPARTSSLSASIRLTRCRSRQARRRRHDFPHLFYDQADYIGWRDDAV